VTDNTNSYFHSVECLVVVGTSTNIYKTEYGSVFSNGSLGTFDASNSGTSVTLTFTPTNTSNFTIKVEKSQIST